MRFWIFMLIINLLIPLIMIIYGKIFLNNAPKEINGVYGYRTTMSMINKDTWDFAHKYIGKLWFIWGLILLIVSIIIMLFVMRKTEDAIGMVGGILCIIQCIPLIGTIFPTEIALKKTFDKNGKRL